MKSLDAFRWARLALAFPLLIAACGDDPTAPDPCDEPPGCDFVGPHLTVKLSVRGTAGRDSLLLPGPVTMDVEVVNRGDSVAPPVVLVVRTDAWVHGSGLARQENVPSLAPGEVWRTAVVDTLLATAVRNDWSEFPLEAVLYRDDLFHIVTSARAPVRLGLAAPQFNASFARDTITFGSEAVLVLSVHNASAFPMAPQTVDIQLLDYDFYLPAWGEIDVPALAPNETYTNAFLVAVPANAGYMILNWGPQEYHVAACILGTVPHLCDGFGVDKHVVGMIDLEACVDAEAAMGLAVAAHSSCGGGPVWGFEAMAGVRYRFTATPGTWEIEIADRHANRVATAVGGEWEASASGRYYVTRGGPEEQTLRVDVITPPGS